MPILAPDVLLEAKGLCAGYGKIDVLRDVHIRVMPSEVVVLVGPNGAGKTTLLKALSGLIPIKAGTLHFSGKQFKDKGPRTFVNAGLSHVVEGHRVFTTLTVSDNLLLAGYDIKPDVRAGRIEYAFSLFPEIAEKRAQSASSLSGGQQQMLAIAQGLVRRPKLLMLDEPSAGLSPVLVDRVLSVINVLKESGTSVLLVEQLVEKAITVSDRVLAMSRGKIVLDSTGKLDDLSDRIRDAYFGT
jgi:branched-chain amino acid transport system ATP-binding protein